MIISFLCKASSKRKNDPTMEYIPLPEGGWGLNDDVVKDLSPALHFGDVPRSAVVGKVKDVT